MPTSMFDIDDALRQLIVNEGSDLHLKVPLLRSSACTAR